MKNLGTFWNFSAIKNNEDKIVISYKKFTIYIQGQTTKEAWIDLLKFKKATSEEIKYFKNLNFNKLKNM